MERLEAPISDHFMTHFVTHFDTRAVPFLDCVSVGRVNVICRGGILPARVRGFSLFSFTPIYKQRFAASRDYRLYSSIIFVQQFWASQDLPSSRPTHSRAHSQVEYAEFCISNDEFYINE